LTGAVAKHQPDWQMALGADIGPHSSRSNSSKYKCRLLRNPAYEEPCRTGGRTRPWRWSGRRWFHCAGRDGSPNFNSSLRCRYCICNETDQYWCPHLSAMELFHRSRDRCITTQGQPAPPIPGQQAPAFNSYPGLSRFVVKSTPPVAVAWRASSCTLSMNEAYNVTVLVI